MNHKPDLKFFVPESWVNLRADKALGSVSEIGSRSRAESLLDSGSILINGQSAKSSYRLKANDEIEIFLPTPIQASLIPLEKPLDVLFEDADLIVLNKPAGLVVHPSVGHQQDTLVNMLLAHTKDLSMGFQENRPGIVHRLDRDTSGVLVVAKNDFTHRALTQKFQARDIHRLYHALCFGPLKSPQSGKIQSYLARHPVDRKRYASLRDSSHKILNLEDLSTSGKWAVTNYRLLAQLPCGISYLQLKLETGRTHQIRVHLSELGCPIVADQIYTPPARLKTLSNKSIKELLLQFPRMALHAAELGFTHPRSSQTLLFSVPWPNDLAPLIASLPFDSKVGLALP